ncbi:MULTISPECIES: type II toxin-antitoxin system ParD family antitoxin [Sphaerospermopsis]|uniref:Putative addiction module antidote protein, CopG/Arc/MetJ family n=1 Tax=Sphaerospermopsis reniformis TaxID=531300 RepID=A0A479ZUX6_9CYAN|nr:MULTISPECIES: type II toxin-antitoxin system ParD family antitoxin [Sphaerospermopsis]MBD2132408.1 type II toxin-antitoxin system ParD family antitoxin [Sphaerospermopsis sp. FACHB-1094]MBD2145240.1 type II toxin-antitoxin system ParD family antitoxin [Sphaerospermopsis sp. FACHB-1194]GCL36347.1 putative addiction module antidote protein, CopG/Arc/MetJ family [Sphaerospermopsis reniformis]
MTTVNISLPDSMRDFINEQVEKGGYSTTSEYIRHLIRQDLERVQQSRIEKLLLEGLDSGEGIEITDEWWEQKRSQLIEKIRKS